MAYIVAHPKPLPFPRLYPGPVPAQTPALSAPRPKPGPFPTARTRAYACGAARAVDVNVDGARQVVVDDVVHARDVETAGRDVRRHQDGRLGGAEPGVGTAGMDVSRAPSRPGRQLRNRR